MGRCQRRRQHGESAATRPVGLFERVLVFVGAAYFHGMKLQVEFSGRALALSSFLCGAWILRIPQDRNARKFRHSFLEQLETFASQHRLDAAEPRDVASGSS